MLPGFRILLMMVVLCAGFLVFGLGAVSLLRTAHLRTAPESLANWRAQADVALAPSDRAATLALLRVDPPTPLLREPPAAAAPTPNDQPAIPDAPEPLTAAAAGETSQTFALTSTGTLSDAPAGASDADKSAAASQAETPAPPMTDVAAVNAPQRVPPAEEKQSSGEQALPKQPSEAPVAQDSVIPPSTEPAAGSPAQAAAADSTDAPAPSAPQAATIAAVPPALDRPLRLAALPDAAATTPAVTVDPVKAAAEAKARHARELRAQRRARARLRARRLAMARARAARLAQTNQTTATETPGFNTSAFPMPGAATTAAANSTTPTARPPR